MTLLTSTLRKKPPLSLKQFMLRSEVLKLYRGYMKLGRLIASQAPDPPKSPVLQSDRESTKRNLHPLQLEWIHWVRSEFRLRQHTAADEEAIRMMLVHGKRQMQELERTILLATNRNLDNSSKLPKTEEKHVTEDTIK